jgi:hypothetical protein
MLVGQLTPLTAVMWWCGLQLAQLPNLASDGVVVLVVCISTPVQVLLLALMARRAGSPSTRCIAMFSC